MALLGESLVIEAAEGAVETVGAAFANAQAKGQARHNSVGERLLCTEAHRRGKRCIASVNLSGKADNGVPSQCQ
jgi:hypothetical protein